MSKNELTIKTLKNAYGQLEATIKMAENERYCIDISTQISATLALLKKAQKELLTQHLRTCVIDSIALGDADVKIAEIEELLKKIL